MILSIRQYVLHLVLLTALLLALAFAIQGTAAGQAVIEGKPTAVLACVPPGGSQGCGCGC